MLFIDIFKLFIGPEFREGIAIAPIILIANLLVGIFFNLSIWYKLTNKTLFGAYIVIIGAALTIFINYLFVPVFGYYAAAWGHIISYSVMVIISFYFGQKYFKIPYNLKRILLYTLVALIIYTISLRLNFDSVKIKYIVHCFMILTYLGIFYMIENRIIKVKI